MARQIIKGAFREERNIMPPCCDVLGAHRLRRKGWILDAGRKRSMQFRGAPTKLADAE
jgi:hypothetical protein